MSSTNQPSERRLRRVGRYLARRSTSLVRDGYLELYRRWNGIPRQTSKIRRFVDREEFLLVVLDACRYDAFADLHDSYLRGNLSKVWAAGRWTADYVRNTWEGDTDLTYVNTIPVISTFYFDERDYAADPTEYFADLVQLWETHWDPDHGTVLAPDVTDATLSAIDEGAGRVVAHYAQPHVPYVGSDILDAWSGASDDGIRSRLEGAGPNPTEHVQESIRRGDITDAALVDAYRANLDYVLEEVRRLVSSVDRPVVVTADHGENLGENGHYLHDDDTVHTRVIPWLAVEGTTDRDRSEGRTDRRGTEKSPRGSPSVGERLERLGYLDA